MESLNMEIEAYSDELIPRTVLCRVHRPESIKMNNNFWQSVDRDNNNVFLFSAYYDNRYVMKEKNYHYVRVIGIVNDYLRSHMTCFLWSNDSLLPSKVTAISTEIWNHFWDNGSSLKGHSIFKAYLFACPVPVNLRNKITAVSLSLNDECSQTLHNYLTIKEYNFTHQPNDFVVCVKGMDYKRDISLQLIEWIELQLLLGADHFTFYTYHVHPNIEKVLNYYKSIGKVETVPYSIPGDGPNLPDERSQYLRDNTWQKRRLELVPYNDCLYRHIYKHKFVVLLDIDESIIPIVHDNWKDLLKDIFDYHKDALNEYASFSAQNTYFFDTFSEMDKSKTIDIPWYMNMLRHIHRSANFTKPGFAVKSFVSTNTTLAMFNHYALIPLYSHMQKYALISKSMAQLNHYRRDCPNGMALECKNDFMKHWKIDTLIWKFKDQLIMAVKSVINKIDMIKV